MSYRKAPIADGARTRSATLVLMLVALLMSLWMLAAQPSIAHASNINFCVEYRAGPVGEGISRCHEPTFRKVTRVNVYPGEIYSGGPMCASALNGNGNLVGGLVCGSEFAGASNGNYTGTLFLQGLVSNAETHAQYITGLEYYNP